MRSILCFSKREDAILTKHMLFSTFKEDFWSLVYLVYFSTFSALLFCTEKVHKTATFDKFFVIFTPKPFPFLSKGFVISVHQAERSCAFILGTGMTVFIPRAKMAFSS